MTVYKVTAKTGYRGYAEGDEFDLELTPDEERRAKARGSIRVVKRDDDDDKPTKRKGQT